MDPNAPAAVFKKSKSRTSRTRPVSPSNDAQDNQEESVAPSTLAAKLKKQHKERAKPKARLSFGVEENEDNRETSQVKKSNRSRSLRASIALRDNVEETPTAQPSSVVYSKEYLSELKANTQSAPPPRRAEADDAEMLLDAGEISGAIVVNEETSTEITTEIPSESTITMAKQRRERVRQTKSTTQNDGDFISLDVLRREETYQGPHPESRLMREEDDLGEGDDEFAEFTAAQERVALGKKAKKKEAASRRAAMQELIEDAGEEDEETMEWEREQLNRGTRETSEPPRNQPTKREYRPAQIPPSTPLPTLDAAISRLSQSLTQLTLSHTTNTTSMSKLADERVILEGKEKEMRIMVEEAESKRSWFSSFREWVETVATFLDEKYPRLEELEEEHISLLKERSDMVSRRRTQDDEDDLSLLLGIPPSKASAEPEEMDELGRVVPQSNSAAARKERRRARDIRHLRHAHPQEEEGFSTDSSLPPSDEADYQAAMSTLHEKVESVLQDVRSDEFRNPEKGVARWFGAWREKYSDTYLGAFGGLGMVSAWEFWVRLEMLGWDPIADPRSLDNFTWFGSLYRYSRPPVIANGNLDEDEADRPLGPDGDLASAMLSTIVPRLCKIIQGGAFDPYSAKHIRVIIDLAEQVETSATREKFELLQKSVFTVFKQAVNADVTLIQPYLELHNSSRFDPEAIPARRRFLSRRYKLLTNISRWRKYTGERSGASGMISALVNDCIRPIAENGWEVGGEEIMQKAMNAVPSDVLSSFPQIP